MWKYAELNVEGKILEGWDSGREIVGQKRGWWRCLGNGHNWRKLEVLRWGTQENWSGRVWEEEEVWVVGKRHWEPSWESHPEADCQFRFFPRKKGSGRDEDPKGSARRDCAELSGWMLLVSLWVKWQRHKATVAVGLCIHFWVELAYKINKHTRILDLDWLFSGVMICFKK